MRILSHSPLRSLVVVGILSLTLAACGEKSTISEQPSNSSTESPTSSVVSADSSASPATGATGNTADSSVIVDAVKKTEASQNYQIELSLIGKGHIDADIPNASPDQEIPLMQMSETIHGTNSQFMLRGYIASFFTGSNDIGIEAMLVDGAGYVRGPLPVMGAIQDKWYVLDEAHREISQPPVHSADILNSLTTADVHLSEFVQSGTETIEGVQCDKYAGHQKATVGAFAWLGKTGIIPSNIDRITKADSEIWVCADGYFRQMRLTIENTQEEYPDQPMVLNMFLKIFDFNNKTPLIAPADAVALEQPILDPSSQP